MSFEAYEHNSTPSHTKNGGNNYFITPKSGRITNKFTRQDYKTHTHNYGKALFAVQQTFFKKNAHTVSYPEFAYLLIYGEGLAISIIQKALSPGSKVQATKHYT